MTEKIFLKNPYLREIDARIIDNKYCNNKYYITLDRTIFNPSLINNQSKDKGTINGIKVIDVFEENDEIIHVIEDNIYNDRVHLAIDWDNRFDLMQQHTGQHLLSSTFYKLYNAKTTDIYIGHDCAYIDISAKEINDEIINKVERFANKVVFSNFKIKTYYMNKEKIDDVPINNPTSTSSDIRVVEIDGVDFSPCNGIHHRSTGEIGLIKIKNWRKIKNDTRIDFVCGNRALDDYSRKNNNIKKISEILSCKADNVVKSLMTLLRKYQE